MAVSILYDDLRSLPSLTLPRAVGQHGTNLLVVTSSL